MPVATAPRAIHAVSANVHAAATRRCHNKIPETRIATAAEMQP